MAIGHKHRLKIWVWRIDGRLISVLIFKCQYCQYKLFINRDVLYYHMIGEELGSGTQTSPN